MLLDPLVVSGSPNPADINFHVRVRSLNYLCNSHIARIFLPVEVSLILQPAFVGNFYISTRRMRRIGQNLINSTKCFSNIIMIAGLGVNPPMKFSAIRHTHNEINLLKFLEVSHCTHS